MTNEEFEKEMSGEIERLKNELVSDDELAGVKRRARANILGGLDSNTGLAQLLAKFEVLTGSWENLFTYLDKAQKVTPADIQRVAKATFVNTNRTVAYMEPAPRSAAAQGNQ